MSKWDFAAVFAAVVITVFIMWQAGNRQPQGMLTIDMRDAAPQLPPEWMK